MVVLGGWVFLMSDVPLYGGEFCISLTCKGDKEERVYHRSKPTEEESSSSLLFSSLQIRDAKSMRLKYEPSSELLHIAVE